MINIWYVYDDANDQWLGDNDWVDAWSFAKEFHSQGDAEEYVAGLEAEDSISAVVFGWVQ